MNKLILFLLFSIPVSGQDAPTIKLSDQIKASPTSMIKLYWYNEAQGYDQPVSIIQGNKISPRFYYIKTFEKEDVKKIINLLRSRKTYGGKDTACFQPDYALLIMDGNVVTGYADISLICNKLISRPAIPASKGFSVKGKEALLHTLKLVSEEDVVAPLEN